MTFSGEDPKENHNSKAGKPGPTATQQAKVRISLLEVRAH